VSAPRLLTLEGVLALTSFSKNHIYSMVKTGDFPAPAKFGRASRWSEAEVSEWITSKFERNAMAS
jgi:prophage regulatory protein